MLECYERGARAGALISIQQSCAGAVICRGDTHLSMAELRCSCCKSGSRKALLEGGVAAALSQEVEALARTQKGLC